MHPNTLKKLSQFIGDPSLPLKHRILFSSIICEDRIILKFPGVPSFKNDWYMYQYLMAISDAQIVTGKIIREEDDLNSFQDPVFESQDLHQLFYYGDKNPEYFTEKPRKAHLIWTKNMNKENILKLNFFKANYASKLVTMQTKLEQKDLDFQEFCVKNAITIIPPLNSIKECVEHLKTKYQRILLACGPQLFQENQDLVDYLVITEYLGKLDQKFLGPKFEMGKEFKKVFESEKIKENEGFIQFSVYSK